MRDLDLTPEQQVDARVRRHARHIAGLKGWARRRRDWEAYLSLHGHGECLVAFASICLEPEVRGETYWRLLSEVWSRGESFPPHYGDLLRIDWEDRWAMMTPQERDELAAMPDVLDVFRGVEDEAHLQGLSWTLDERQAIWFAGRGNGQTRGTVAHGRVRRDVVVAYLTGRNEREIIAFPESVDVISVRPAQVALTESRAPLIPAPRSCSHL